MINLLQKVTHGAVCAQNGNYCGEYIESVFIISGITLSSVIMSTIKSSHKVSELIQCSSAMPCFAIRWLNYISVGSCTV